MCVSEEEIRGLEGTASKQAESFVKPKSAPEPETAPEDGSALISESEEDGMHKVWRWRICGIQPNHSLVVILNQKPNWV